MIQRLIASQFKDTNTVSSELQKAKHFESKQLTGTEHHHQIQDTSPTHDQEVSSSK